MVFENFQLRRLSQISSTDLYERRRGGDKFILIKTDHDSKSLGRAVLENGFMIILYMLRKKCSVS